MAKTSKSLVKAWSEMEDDRRNRVVILPDSQIGLDRLRRKDGEIHNKANSGLVGTIRKEYGDKLVVRFRSDARLWVSSKGGLGKSASKNLVKQFANVATAIECKAPMANKNLYIEKHPNGYAVLRPNAERASAIAPTQAKAIAIARELNPGHSPDVERVRYTSVGKPDRWRKA